MFLTSENFLLLKYLREALLPSVAKNLDLFKERKQKYLVYFWGSGGRGGEVA